MKRRTAQLPLHNGKAPAWLFQRMQRLAGAITMAVVQEYGPEEMLNRLADPWWFQAFGCVLGFDWHSSGLTTVTCGALKEAYRETGADMGIHVAGGKGASSRKTPQQIDSIVDSRGISTGERLIYSSRMSAKVDSAAVQDGCQIYAHTFFFTDNGRWCVVQQGLDEPGGVARRYHWLSESFNDFVCEPHAGFHDNTGVEKNTETDSRAMSSSDSLLNMVAEEGEENRKACTELTQEDPDKLHEMLTRYTEGPTLFVPERHLVLPRDVNVKRMRSSFRNIHEQAPEDFQKLLETKGVGPASVRALALLAELIHGTPPSRRDLAGAEDEDQERSGHCWADYSYAHGGKDGTPFPVDREAYDRSITVLTDAVRQARMGRTEKNKAFRRLSCFFQER